MNHEASIPETAGRRRVLSLYGALGVVVGIVLGLAAVLFAPAGRGPQLEAARKRATMGALDVALDEPVHRAPPATER